MPADEEDVPPVEECWQHITDAWTSESWKRLGYETWAEYLAGEWEIQRGDEEPETIRTARLLYAAGMPVVAISVTLGARKRTIREDWLRGVRRGTAALSGVYVVGSPQWRPVKIGTGDPARRLSQLQVGTPFPLNLLWSCPGDRALEKALHARFAEYRVRGEWFEFPADQDPVKAVVSAVAELRPGLGVAA
ncbi:GIY-YIG nuclease family protein [Streptomyces chartreusis]|uniref:GIY-YIG nuclease family protein n=1 Tax=Streptomyces chartreusis TaxID=1969 RepID=UPI002E197AE9